MEVKEIVKEIQQLPLSKKFFVMEQTLKSIKKEELNLQSEKAIEKPYDEFANDTELKATSYLINEKSLAKDWLSVEDDNWDKVL
jgi:hypothetical protein